MSTFDETLNRVLNPEGIYWSGLDDDLADPAVEQVIQLRLDVPLKHVAAAVEAMRQDGWNFTEQPDEPHDPQQRLLFQRRQNLLSQSKVTMLTNALRVVFPIEGARLWTWVVVADGDQA